MTRRVYLSSLSLFLCLCIRMIRLLFGDLRAPGSTRRWLYSRVQPRLRFNKGSVGKLFSFVFRMQQGLCWGIVSAEWNASKIFDLMQNTVRETPGQRRLLLIEVMFKEKQLSANLPLTIGEPRQSLTQNEHPLFFTTERNLNCSRRTLVNMVGFPRESDDAGGKRRSFSELSSRVCTSTKWEQWEQLRFREVKVPPQITSYLKTIIYDYWRHELGVETGKYSARRRRPSCTLDSIASSADSLVCVNSCTITCFDHDFSFFFSFFFSICIPDWRFDASRSRSRTAWRYYMHIIQLL